jgi:hypothetical protein
MSDDLPLEPSVTQPLQPTKYQSYDEMVQADLSLLRECEAELQRIADKFRPAEVSSTVTARCDNLVTDEDI